MSPLFFAPVASPLALGMPQGYEWLIIGAIGLLLFGKRLPEVGRSLGKGIIEFKKGLKGIGDEIEEESNKPDRLPATETPKTLPPQNSVSRNDPVADEAPVAQPNATA